MSEANATPEKFREKLKEYLEQNNNFGGLGPISWYDRPTVIVEVSPTFYPERFYHRHFKPVPPIPSFQTPDSNEDLSEESPSVVAPKVKLFEDDFPDNTTELNDAKKKKAERKAIDEDLYMKYGKEVIESFRAAPYKKLMDSWPLAKIDLKGPAKSMKCLRDYSHITS